MKRSENRILVTHVGALPRPQELGSLVMTKTRGEAHDDVVVRGHEHEAEHDHLKI